MHHALVAWLSAALFLAGCGTNHSYRTADLASDRAYKAGKRSPQLPENEVLGLRAETATDADIGRILDETRSFSLPAGSAILLVQSGAPHPDAEMTRELAKHFTVTTHTGVPSEVRSEGDGGITASLRLAAARAKAETIVVYWGTVEMKRDDLPTGLVSWVPVVDFMVPDEYQKVRMHLRVALIDVRTGQWATFRTEPVEQETLTTRYAREKAPNWPLRPVKERAYQACVRKLAEGYVTAGR